MGVLDGPAALGAQPTANPAASRSEQRVARSSPLPYDGKRPAADTCRLQAPSDSRPWWAGATTPCRSHGFGRDLQEAAAPQLGRLRRFAALRWRGP